MVRVRVDFSNVEDGPSIPGAGQYRGVIDKFEKKISQNSGNEMIVLTYKITAGENKGDTVLDFLTLTEKSLWKLKQRLEAFGINVKKKSYDIDGEDLVGLPILLQLGDPRTTPQGNKVPNIIEVAARGEKEEEEPDTEEEEEIEPTPKRKAKASRNSDDDEEEEEEEQPRKKVKVKHRSDDDEEEEEEEERPRRLAKVERLR